jgi:4-hydroxy-tetrahydrodipicolinate synthase
MSFGQLVTAMVTPLQDDLTINWDITAKLIDYLIGEQKSDALVISGTTGESPTLTDDEKAKLFRFAVERAAGRCLIIAGTGSNDTAHSIHLTRLAEQAGVDGILLVTPYYNKPNQDGLYRHFRAVAESTKLPIMLYNVPGRSGVSLTTETTLRLASDLPNVKATKECASLDQMTEIVKDAPAGFELFSGEDSLTLPALAVGARGVVSVASHIIGAKMKGMIDAYRAGKVEEAARLNSECYPVLKGLFYCPHAVPNPVAVKYALTQIGLQVGGVRLPLVTVTDEEAEFLRRMLSKVAPSVVVR